MMQSCSGVGALSLTVLTIGGGVGPLTVSLLTCLGGLQTGFGAGQHGAGGGGGGAHPQDIFSFCLSDLF